MFAHCLKDTPTIEGYYEYSFQPHPEEPNISETEYIVTMGMLMGGVRGGRSFFPNKTHFLKIVLFCTFKFYLIAIT